MSNFIPILKTRKAGSSRMDSAPLLLVECLGMSRQVRARGDAQRKPEVEGVVARVVVRNAGMLVERLRGRSPLSLAATLQAARQDW